MLIHFRILVGILVCGLVTTGHTQEPNFTLVVDQNRVSLTAKDATIEKILRALHHQKGIQVHGSFVGQKRVNLHFKQLPIATAMQQLRQQTGLDYIIRTHQGNDLGKSDIVQIYILSSKTSSVPRTYTTKPIVTPAIAPSLPQSTDSQATGKKKPLLHFQIDPFQY